MVGAWVPSVRVKELDRPMLLLVGSAVRGINQHLLQLPHATVTCHPLQSRIKMSIPKTFKLSNGLELPSIALGTVSKVVIHRCPR